MSTQEPDLERGDGALKPPPLTLNGQTKSTASSISTQQPPQQQQYHVGTPLRYSKPKSRPLSQVKRPFSHLIPPHDPDAIPPKLLKLRTVMGISTPTSLLPSSASRSPSTKRPGPNRGIYARVIAEERQARLQFYFTASLINTCYLAQIIVAAALTALGASSASHIAITLLGAVNTVIAGILTYLKGQGLPNRLRMYWNSLRKCREFIEEKERECAAEGWGEGLLEWGDEGMDVDREIEIMVRMYHDVRQTAEDNTPDTYLPMGGGGTAAAAALAAKGAANGKMEGIVGAGAGAAGKEGSVRYPEDEEDEDHEHEHEHDGGSKSAKGKSPVLMPLPMATPTAPGGETATGPVDGKVSSVKPPDGK